ncbi:MAG TPA: exodeoxyribonuclease VII small subunit [Patescibacteria group bacterium]|jgi:exonuclease VII small subunit|nr:exodeoxyribonuclease VII small subunit [Patescibacteria group bacterium]
MSKQSKEVPLRELLKQLDLLVDWFNQDDFDVEEGLAKFQDGTALIQTINLRLTTLEHEVSIIKKRFDQ